MIERDTVIALIDELKAFDGVILVEGKKDERALARYGIRTQSIDTSPDTIIEALAREYDRILILTDTDEEGRRLHDQVRAACERVSINDDPRLRRAFFTATKLRTVEGFDTLCERLRIDSDKSLV